MEVKSANDGLLTNAEVLALLKEHKSDRATRRAQDSDSSERHQLSKRDVVEAKAMEYITESDCGQCELSAIQQCLRAVKSAGYDMTEGELLQLANHLPNTSVAVHLIVEDCYERLDEEKIDQLLEIMKEARPQES
jgi:DNA-directed RNA polymerase subunit F